jgi:hypothetical protein
VAERKDVLSAFFFMLTLLAYAKYSRTGRWVHYGVVVLFFVLGLMAKPMLVTVPVVLILLDFWPLRRFSLQDLKSPRTLLPLLEEKVPFLMIGFLFSIVAVLAQIHSGVAMPFSGGYPMWIRIVNAMGSYGTYLVLTVWPAGLVPFYQHAGEQVSLWKAGVSVMAILAAAAFACWKAPVAS